MASDEAPSRSIGISESCRDEGLIILALSLVVYTPPFLLMLWRVPPRRGIGYWERAYTYSLSSKEGFLLEVVSALFSVCSCVTYIAGTYLGDDTPVWFTPVEISFSTYFAIQFGISLLIAPVKFQFIFSIQSLVDVFTVLPVLIATAVGSCGQQFGVFAAARVMKFFRVLRLLRVLRSFQLLTDTAEDAIRRQTMRLISMVVVILVVTTGFVQYLANDLDQTWLGVAKTCSFETTDVCDQYCDTCWEGSDGLGYCTFLHAFHSPDAISCSNRMSFHDSLYYTIVTFSTVGYGDVVPVTPFSRIAMVFLISVTIYGVPYQVNKLQSLRELRTDFDGSFRPTLGRAFVILCANGNVDVRPFVAEFFHEDHSITGISAPQLVLLVDTVPSTELRHTLLKYSVKSRLFFVRGDATSATDLGRARADCADAIFLMADRSAEDQDAQDHLTTLRAITSRRTNPDVKIYAQLLQPENKDLILAAGVESRNVMAMNQLRLGLLGLSVGCPGFPTVILNLIQSISWRQSIAVADWHEEYSEGTTMEIYNFKPKEALVGWRFGDLAKHMKSEGNACLIAIARSPKQAGGRVSPNDKAEKPGKTGIFFNPGAKYEIQEEDTLFALADEASRLQRYEAVDPLARASHLERASTAVYNMLPEGMAPHDQRGKELAKPIHMKEAENILAQGSGRLSRALSRQKIKSFEFPEQAEGGGVEKDRKRSHESSEDDVAPFNGGRGGETAPPAYDPKDAAAAAGGMKAESGDIAPVLPGASEEPRGDSPRDMMSSELTHKSRDSAGPLELEGSSELSANGSVRRQSSTKPPPPQLAIAQGERKGSALFPRSPMAKTSSFTSTPSATGWWAEGNGEGGASLRPDVAPVNRSLDKLLDSIVETFGEEGRGMSDNIRSYFQYRLNELLVSTGELGIGNHPKLVDRLITRLPKDASGHIIVVCTTLDDMQDFLRPLHQMRRNEPETVVVFICERFPTTREWIEAAAFPGVYVMMGENAAGLHRSLENARVKQSKSVLFCADLAKLALSTQLADCAVMQGTLQAHALTLHEEKVSLVCELTQGGFTRRLAENLHRSSVFDDVQTSSQTSSSGAASSSQAAAAKKLKSKSINNLRKTKSGDDVSDGGNSPIRAHKHNGKPTLLKSDSMRRKEEEILLGEERALEVQMEAANLMQGFLHLETAFVAGLTVPTSLLDLLVCQQYFNPHMMSLVQQFILGRDGSVTDDEQLGESVMHYRKVPPDMVGMQFGEAYEKMIDDDGTLIIGLYRVWSKDNKDVQKYVYTNPRVRTTLRESDGLYCIAPSSTMPS